MRKKKIKILHVAQAAGGVDRYIRMLLKYLDMPRLNLEIGRYINYSKLESMLSTQTLFFCNASRFDDEYEGEIPLEFFDGWAQQSEENYRRLNELKSHVCRMDAFTRTFPCGAIVKYFYIKQTAPKVARFDASYFGGSFTLCGGWAGRYRP